MTFQAVLEMVSELPKKQRSQLIAELVSTEFPSGPSEKELDSRLDDVLSGKVKGIPGNESMRQLRELAGIKEPSMIRQASYEKHVQVSSRSKKRP